LSLLELFSLELVLLELEELSLEDDSDFEVEPDDELLDPSRLSVR
jgi:hypothetical protein